MFVASELRAQMARKNFTQKKLAKSIGVSEKTMVLKIKTGKFGTDEVFKIMSILDIKDPTPIFFAHE